MKTEKELVIKYVSKFISEDLNRAAFFCLKFMACNESIFRSKQPQDYLIELLGKICEGKRKCYLDDYKKFRGSVYYHLNNAMLNCLKKNSKDEVFLDAYDDTYSSTDNGNGSILDKYSIIDHEEIFRQVDNYELKEKLFELFHREKEKPEIELLEKILLGKSNKEAAEDMRIKVRDVENIKKRIHRRIYNKLDKNYLKGIIKWEEERLLETS